MEERGHIMEKTMEKIVALAKSRGFVYPGSEIYGGLANTWDYGNLGVELKNNVKKAWWQKFIQESPYNVGVDCAILMNPQTWVASGHLGGFSDPLMDCKECHERFRADKIIEDFAEENHIELKGSVDGWTQEEMKDFIADNNVPCPTCGKHNFTDIRQFNLMFKTFQGVTEDAKNTVYLRPVSYTHLDVYKRQAFRTPPKDSTGVAHILEHSVLCGSREFPLKDPFVELVKGSLNTFLNADVYKRQSRNSSSLSEQSRVFRL